jgi:hypothetical protein
MDDLKYFFYFFAGMMLFLVVGSVIESSTESKRNIQCLEIGGRYVYENNSWVCLK